MLRPWLRLVDSLRCRAVAWLARYAPAELACAPAALLCASLAAAGGAAAEAMAVAGTAGEIAVFYAVMGTRELRNRGGLTALPAAARDLAVEFGPAEALDGLLLRPLLLYAGISLIGHPALGALLGKLVADIVFYSLAIAGRGLVERRALRATC